MRIGIFLGSFDPIHIGHYANIIQSLDKTNPHKVGKIIIVPAFHNPWKEDKPAPFELRYQMCNTIAHLINRELGNDTVIVSDIESKIESEVKYSYLVLQKLQEQFPKDKLVIICGTDISKEVKEWKEGQWIVDNFELLIIDRGGYTESQFPTISISSSQIRGMISNGQCPLPYILSPTYAQIKKFKLYNCKLKY